MFYALHELQDATNTPIRLWADANRYMFGSPWSPWSYLPGSERIVAGSELIGRVLKHYEKPDFGLDEIKISGKTVKFTKDYPCKLDFCHLLHFERQQATPQALPKVLVVAPLSGHYASLLRDTVKALLADHDVYITDWLDGRQVPMSAGGFGLGDYVNYVQQFIEFLGADVHIVAVCQPTVPVLATVSLMASNSHPLQPKSMTLMGGPIDTRENPTAVNIYAKQHSLRWFEMNVIERVPVRYDGYGRQVYPGFFQHAGFVAMNPQRHMQAHLDFYHNLLKGDGESAEAHRRFYDEYNAVMDLPAEFYLETIAQVFQEHTLPMGKMVFNGQRVDPSAIKKTALLTVEGEQDDISAPGQTEAAQKLCSSLPKTMRKHLLAKDVGHYGVFSGRRWRESTYPQVRDFIKANS